MAVGSSGFGPFLISLVGLAFAPRHGPFSVAAFDAELPITFGVDPPFVPASLVLASVWPIGVCLLQSLAYMPLLSRGAVVCAASLLGCGICSIAICW